MKPGWKEKNRNIHEHLIERLNKFVRTSKSGEGVLTSFNAESVIALLAQTIIFSDAIPESQFIPITFEGVLQVVKTKNGLTSEDVIRTIAQIQKRFLATAAKRYAITTTISIKRNESVASKFFHRRKVNQSIISFNLAHQIYDLTPTMELALNLGLPDEPTDYKHVRLFISARTEQEAIDKAIDDLNFLRSLWNFSLNHGIIRREFSGNPNAINQIQLGPIAHLHECGKKTPIMSVWTFPTTFQRARVVQSIGSQVDRIYKYETRIRRKIRYSPFRELIFRSLIEYCAALDSQDYETAFISLWRVLEDLSCINANESHIEIVNRISSIFKNRLYQASVLEILRKRRNRSVHPGLKTELPDHFVNELRMRVEETILFLVENKFHLKSPDELRTFFLVSREPDILKKEIAVRKKSIRLIRMS